MSAEGRWGMVQPSTMAPLHSQTTPEYFGDSVNAVSFGFVATAILIAMFLLLAVFEKFLRRQRSTESSARTHVDLEEQMGFGVGGKLQNPLPKMTIYGRGALVLMPGQQIPTFIAHPAPAPCRPEPISWPLHHNPSILAPLTPSVEG